MIQNEVVIASACRTAIGSFQGSLKDVRVVELGRVVGEEAIKRAKIKKKDVDNVICGNVIQAGAGGNVGRQIQAAIGIPWEASACTVNQLCVSSMRALEIGYQNIRLGLSEVCLVVGVENMSMAPYLLPKARPGYRMGPGTIEDAMLLDALVCSIENYHMGVTAENVAQDHAISREQQDALALLSQKRAAKAIKGGVFENEIVPIEVKQKKESVIFDTDEFPRPFTTAEGLSSLKPAFKENGTVTAGNASGVNDGAAAVILMSENKARELKLSTFGRVAATANAGVEPAVMGLGPARAIPKALKYSGISFEEVNCFEINEAFAAQFLGVEKLLREEYGCELDREKVNPNGSGISLGHPLGCSGLRIVVSLVHQMQKIKARYGCAFLCAGGVPGMAVIIDRE
jgi:acetyl-CoA C-acetyltransferase